MREAGDICYADVFKDGTGVVEYTRQDDMKYAIKKLDDTKFKSHEVSLVQMSAEGPLKFRSLQSKSFGSSFLHYNSAESKVFTGKIFQGETSYIRVKEAAIDDRYRSRSRSPRGSPKYSPKSASRSRSRSPIHSASPARSSRSRSQ